MIDIVNHVFLIYMFDVYIFSVIYKVLVFSIFYTNNNQYKE